mmetsp:Transcript_22482/g.56383  ORF Transcript_22482/g.56383 Transcript_22482/m.56383 type:complete len:620 (-) Transcript_22482:95-1954(-)
MAAKLKTGMLDVHVREARDLFNRGSNMAVFIYITVVTKGLEDRKKSIVCQKTCNPVWDAHHVFKVHPSFVGLKIECWDGKHFMGCINFPASYFITRDDQRVMDWYKWEKRSDKDKVKGEVYARMYYLSDEQAAVLKNTAREKALAAYGHTIGVDNPQPTMIQLPITDKSNPAVVARATSPSPLDRQQRRHSSNLNVSTPERGSSRSQTPMRPAAAAHIDVAATVNQLKEDGKLDSVRIDLLLSLLEDLNRNYEDITKCREAGGVDVVLSFMCDDKTSVRLRCISCAVLSHFREHDNDMVSHMVKADIGKYVVTTLKGVEPGTASDNLELLLQIMKNVDGHNDFRDSLVDAGFMDACIDFLKSDPLDPTNLFNLCPAMVQLVEAVNQIASKNMAKKMISSGAAERALEICIGPESKNELVVEKVIPFIASMASSCADCSLITLERMRAVLELMKTHRPAVQMMCSVLLTLAAEKPEFASELAKSGAIPLLANLFKSAETTPHLEDKIRDNCIRAFKSIASIESADVFAELRTHEVEKKLLSVMMDTTPKLTTQIHCLLLAQALLKDEGVRDKLLASGLGRMIESAAAKHSQTRLQKLSHDINNTYNMGLNLPKPTWNTGQ